MPDKYFQLIQGDAKEALKQFEDNTFQTVITSPPYWQLRDYFVEGQLGHETTPEEYVEKLVDIFREVKRVLRKDGTAWLIIGDSFSTPKKGNTQKNVNSSIRRGKLHTQLIDKKKIDLPAKNKIGIPWLVAFGLQKDGWFLRQDIIWSKRNPCPDSAFDRPTSSHEYIFLLSKSPRYYYDYYATLEASKQRIPSKRKFGAKNQKGTYRQDQNRTFIDNGKRNKRSVWTTSIGNNRSGHFAVFPVELIEPCVLAGVSEKGCCPKCKAPWKRIVEKNYVFKGWKPSCNCGIEETEPCLVLDPFCGTSTTGVVAIKHGCNYVGIDLNKDYLERSRDKLYEAEPIFVKEI
jgi:DNA modification methylase